MGDEAEARIARLTSIPDSVMFQILAKNGRDNREKREMAVRSTRGRPQRSAPSSTRKAAPARKPAPKTPAAAGRDVTAYASKTPTAYHKAFARWIIDEVGFDPNSVSSMRAFLMGVSIATAARPAYNSSDAYEEFRENSGEAKRGPKPKVQEEKAPARGRRKPAPEPEEEDDDFEEDIDEEADDLDDDSDDFEDDDDSDDDDSEDDDDDDFDDEEEEETPPPAKSRRAPARGAAKGAARSAPARKAAPAKKAASARSQPAAGRRTSTVEDDDFLF